MLKSEPEMSPPKFKRKLRLGRLEMRKKQTLRASGEEVQGSTTEGPKCTEPEASPASPCKRPTSAIWDGGGHAAQAYATAPECCDYAALQESSTLLPPERTETDKEAIKEGRDGEEGERHGDHVGERKVGSHDHAVAAVDLHGASFLSGQS